MAVKNVTCQTRIPNEELSTHPNAPPLSLWSTYLWSSPSVDALQTLQWCQRQRGACHYLPSFTFVHSNVAEEKGTDVNLSLIPSFLLREIKKNRVQLDECQGRLDVQSISGLFPLSTGGGWEDGCLVSWCVIEDFTSQLVNRNHNKRCLCHDKIPMEVDWRKCMAQVKYDDVRWKVWVTTSSEGSVARDPSPAFHVFLLKGVEVEAYRG